ncbi:MAG: AAA-like domain-containing protein [Phormidesmis sp.]
MPVDSVINLLNRNLIESQHRPLTPTEVTILRGIWQYQTYKQIALEAEYSPDYFTNVVAPGLWKRLSKLIGQRVTKKTCRVLIEAYATSQTAGEQLPPTLGTSESAVTRSVAARSEKATADNTTHEEALRSTSPPSNELPRYPSGSVPMDSPYYVERIPLEKFACQEIEKPGALVRIKAPQEMGKTSMLLRVLSHANKKGYRTVSLNLEQIDKAILSDLNRFLRWLCANVSLQLQLQPKLDDYWDEDIGAKISCTLYFQDYLLAQLNEPFVLALDEVNQLFEHPQVAKDVLPLFRSWYEEAKRLRIWQKLRLIVIHSTEIYVPLQLRQSPFNVGLPIQLEGFTLTQIQQLAKCYGMSWETLESQAIQLSDILGGHPALVHIALYSLHQGDTTLTQLLENSSMLTGIYHHHLQRHWATLDAQPDLKGALISVMEASEPISLEPMMNYKLSSMGLIKQIGNKVVLGCELYRQSFLQN